MVQTDPPVLRRVGWGPFRILGERKRTADLEAKITSRVDELAGPGEPSRSPTEALARWLEEEPLGRHRRASEQQTDRRLDDEGLPPSAKVAWSRLRRLEREFGITPVHDPGGTWSKGLAQENLNNWLERLSNVVNNHESPEYAETLQEDLESLQLLLAKLREAAEEQSERGKAP